MFITTLITTKFNCISTETYVLLMASLLAGTIKVAHEKHGVAVATMQKKHAGDVKTVLIPMRRFQQNESQMHVSFNF